MKYDLWIERTEIHFSRELSRAKSNFRVGKIVGVIMKGASKNRVQYEEYGILWLLIILLDNFKRSFRLHDEVE
jgi:hypothetical protein